MRNTIINDYLIRFTPLQKAKFRNYIKNNFDCQVDKSLLSNNIIIGNPKSGNLIVMAHYDTPPNMKILMYFSNKFGTVKGQIYFMFLIISGLFLSNLISTSFGLFFQLLILLLIISQLVIPNKNNVCDNTSGVIMALELYQKHKNICVVLTDVEEYGLFGSRQFRKQYKPKQEIIVVDCVSDGDLVAILKTNGSNDKLNKVFKGNNTFESIQLNSKLIASDNLTFNSQATLISSVSRTKFGSIYIPNMHTNKDINFDKNIYNYIFENLSSYINLKNG